MPHLARLGTRVSQVLHHLIYSFPTPDNVTLFEWDDEDVTGGNSTDGNTTMRIARYLAEPGEDKAFAQGVGPLSFFGSGYGVMLIFIVRPRPIPRESSLTFGLGDPAQSDTQYRAQAETAASAAASPAGELDVLARSPSRSVCQTRAAGSCCL